MPDPLYVTYQEGLRDPVDRAALLGEWKAKSKTQKIAWRDAYNAVRDAQGDVDEASTEVDRLYRDLHNDFGAGDLDIRIQANYNEFLRRIKEMQDQYDVMAKQLIALADAYSRLREVEAAQNPIDQSMTYAENTANAFRTQAQQANDLARAMRVQVGDPPVVPDALGRRRMPARWLIENSTAIRFKARIVSDVEGARLRMDPMEVDDVQDAPEEKQEATEAAEGETDEWEGVSSKGEHDLDKDKGERTDVDSELDGEELEAMLDRGTWVPQAILSGGCSIGHVWLKVNRLNQITDVSPATFSSTRNARR
jgi:hypothetical protein